jgi:nicotinate-nucleotide--dimethylbenzimidazole phosphoribosyltransferase
MTDTITESFCERCGTRYSLEPPARRRPLGVGRVRVLTRGLRNYVTNDGMPMAEAMAAARQDEERSSLTRQLDAFHQTFNFCLGCRQYTCASCWNEKAGECLTCAPDLSREVLPPAFPDLPAGGPQAEMPAPVEATSWPRIDLDRVPDGGNGLAPVESQPSLARGGPIAPEAPDAAEPLPSIPVAQPAPSAAEPAETLAAAAPAGAPDSELTADELAAVQLALAAARATAPEPAELAPEQAVPAQVEAAAEGAAPQAPPLEASEEAAPVEAVPAEAAVEVEPEAAVAPEAVPVEAAAEVEPEAAVAPETAAVEPETAAVEPAADELVAPEPAPEPAAVEAAPEPATPEDHVTAGRRQTRSLLGRFRPARTAGPSRPAAQGAPEAAPPVAVPPPAAPAPAAPAAFAPRDTVEQPTWRVTAPDTPPAAPPSWPETPAWPATPLPPPQAPPPAASPWAARLATSRPEAGVWAASSQEVLGAPAPAGRAAAPAVQSCVSCGLSLSANARFCRRCGSRQS